MNMLINAPRRIARRLVSPLRPKSRAWLETLPGFAVPVDAVEALHGPQALRRALLEQIAQATRRIVIVTLYLQDDDAGREVMDALYAAHAQRPGLEIDVFVDWHRAQRGLIGKQKSPGNAAMYRDYAQRLGAGVRVWGVPVQNRELFGVLHLKGFVFDDTVLYSGASLNDVYLAMHGRYRLDRCHRIRDAALADVGACWQRLLSTLPLGHHLTSATEADLAWPAKAAPAAEPELLLAVVGAHLQGMPLHTQLTERGARLVQATTTSPHYTLHALPGTVPPKPGLARVAPDAEPGHAIALEVYALPVASVGSFLALIPPPLGLGSVELAD